MYIVFVYLYVVITVKVQNAVGLSDIAAELCYLRKGGNVFAVFLSFFC